MIGKTLGHYQISNQLGKGGMGEVFQAKDQVLAREVAIKILPEEFATDADRVARFQREAKVLASLNHPNIAAIHGFEQSEGKNFLVMELVEGETLAERLKRGPIPVEESLKLSLQIAEALEAAHEKGVIHRDLKPSNIKVTPDGKVKVLDFGLAKAFAGEQAELNLSNSPTLSDAATQQGVILGTAAYMSPEQARGKAVDKRADIWALGCVLYEMLTGRQTWSGATVTDIIAAAIAKDPDFSRLPPNLNPDIRKLLNRCLQKDPAERFRDVGDVRVEIKQILADPGGVFARPVTATAPQTRLRKKLSWAAATLILIIIAGVAVWKLKPSEPRQVMRFEYELPEGQQLAGGSWPNLAVSPDGKQFVYGTTKGLYLRSVDELTAKLIAGTEEETRQPFFSSDGKWIGYISYSDRKLKKIAITGGAPVALCDIVGAYNPSWSADDIIVYGTQEAIMRVSANGGTPEPLIKAKGNWLYSPQILPGGKSMLYITADVAGTRPRMMMQSLKSGESKELFASSGGRYLPTGHIVYTLQNNSSLFAIPFDLNRLEVKGGPVPVVEGTRQTAVSDAGTLAYIPGTVSAAAPAQFTLVWVDRKGKEEPIEAPLNSYGQPKISPDGTRVALTVGPFLNEDIWIWDLVRKTMTRLTFEKRREITPIWTPDSKRIIYWSNHEDAGGNLGALSGNGGIYWRPADGAGGVEKLGSAPDRQLFPWSLSRDGKVLLMQELVTLTNLDIGMLSMEPDHKRKELLQGEYEETQPVISPDGQWMAYASNEATGVSMKTDIYVRPFPDVNKGKWQVSMSGGSCPLWSPDGRELFYLSADNSLMAVAVETKPTISFGAPKMLFKSTYLGLTSTSGTPFDIHPDGKRFLMIKPSAPKAATPAAAVPHPKINIVVNWFEELKQRVPIK